MLVLSCLSWPVDLQLTFDLSNSSFFVTGMCQDTIQTVFYSWAMQLMDSDEVPEEESYYPVWRLREMQQAGIKALIQSISSFCSTLPSLNQLLNEQCARTLPSVQEIFHRLFYIYICPDGSSFFLFFFADVSNACHSQSQLLFSMLAEKGL